MDPKIYEEKRNALIGILDGIMATATDLPEETRTKLAEAAEKLKRNSFEIALVGEFQGGKSTTFNTYCDWRLISPVGVGIKTSATKISAQAIPPEDEERAELRWKSDDELMLTMLPIVQRQLEGDPDHQRLFMGDELPRLRDPEIFAIAQRAISDEWAFYEANRQHYVKLVKDGLDTLQIATVILKYFNDPGLEELRATERVSINELSKFVQFPVDWVVKWESDGVNANWDLEQTAFVFLGGANCFIHSTNLERLGCIITDCPGLFAGPWDTKIATEAIRSADAVLYLIGGSTSMKEGDKRALSEIIKSQQQHKLYFAINARQTRANTLEALRPADFAIIKSLGIDLQSEEKIDVLNALIAYDSKADGLSDTERRKFTRAISTYCDIDPFSEQEKLRKLVGDPDEAYKASDLLSLTLKIETDIVSKKFKTILLDGGTTIVSDALDKLAADLKQDENLASERVDRARQEAIEARRQLKLFQEFVTTEVETSISNPDHVTVVSDDYYQSVYGKNVKAMSSEIAEAVAKAFASSKGLIGLLIATYRSMLNRGSCELRDADLACFKDVVAKPINGILTDYIQKGTEGWLTNVTQQNNTLFKVTYTGAITSLKEMFKARWNDQYESIKKLEGLGLEGDWENLSTGVDKNLRDIDIGDQEEDGTAINCVIRETKKMFMQKIAVFLVAPLVGSIGGLGAGLLVGVVAGGSVGVAGLCVATLPAIIAALTALVVITYAFSHFFIDRLIGVFKDRLMPKIQTLLEAEFKKREKEIKDAFTDCILKPITQIYKDRVRASLSNQLRQFEDRVRNNEDNLLKSEDEKRVIAEKARRVRIEQIEPARARVAEFQEGLKQYFN